LTSKILSEVAEGFRLSPQQRRLWHLHETWPEVRFGIQCTVRIHGALDVARLQSAVTRIVSRHEVLRTKFAFLEGTSVPVQVVSECASGLDHIIDLSGENETCQAVEIKRVAEEQWERLRRPGDAPAVSIVCAVLSEHSRVLLVTASALCAVIRHDAFWTVARNPR